MLRFADKKMIKSFFHFVKIIILNRKLNTVKVKYVFMN